MVVDTNDSSRCVFVGARTRPTGVANVVATAIYLFLAPVDLAAAAALGAGALVGAWLGPRILRVMPERPLRYAMPLAGLGLAGWLWLPGS
jgi:uncharacterized membrane protein YfcA